MISLESCPDSRIKLVLKPCLLYASSKAANNVAEIVLSHLSQILTHLNATTHVHLRGLTKHCLKFECASESGTFIRVCVQGQPAYFHHGTLYFSLLQ